jgi:CHAT domain-containing protein
VNLDPGEGRRILYYSLGEARGDLLVIDSDGISAHHLSQPDRIATLVERFRILVQRPEAEPAPLLDVARRLHEVLLAPAAGRLAGAEQLLILADGPLLLLPFSALRDADGRYLVENYRIRRLHTLDSNDGERLNAESVTRGFAGFAYSGGGKNAADQRIDHGPLRFVDQEVARAAAVFGDNARQHVGPAATETRARAVQGNRILHFASHAVADPVQPLSSYIALAADEHNDGRMALWEIMADVQLDAGLVVLSACDTALGPSFAGEGLFGLAKGFAFAGAESVMASLWAIDDASTMYLSEVFYQELAAGRTPAAALSQAQRAMLEGEIPATGWVARLLGKDTSRDYSHPYYWAAFTLTATR